MQKKVIRHTEMKYFKISGRHLLAGGKTIEQIAAIAGQTPFYIYDRAIVLQKISEFRQHIPAPIALHYAMKANPMPSLVSYIADHVDGLDVASQKEMLIALGTNIPPQKISFAGPGKLPLEIAAAIAAGITLNIESELELDRALEIGRSLSLTPRLAIRVNPDFELKSSGMKMGGGPKQFGIDAERVPAAIQKIISSEANFIGLHIYSGSQNLKFESLIEAHNKTFELAARICQESNSDLQKLNIGGGFGIPYFPGESPLELEPIGQNLQILLDKFSEDFKSTQIVMELGRFLVGECGLYVSRVNDKKVSRGHTYLIADGGLHHHLANSGNFGQVIRKNYPVAIANRMDGAEFENVSIVGPLCTPLDTLADKIDLPKAELEDLVAIFQSGAYGATASPRGFLSQPDLVELLL